MPQDFVPLFNKTSSSEVQLLWLVLFAAEHGSYYGPWWTCLFISVVIVVGNAFVSINIAILLSAVFAGFVSLYVPHGCFALALLLGISNIGAKHSANADAHNSDLYDSVENNSFDINEHLGDECPPKFCF